MYIYRSRSPKKVQMTQSHGKSRVTAKPFRFLAFCPSTRDQELATHHTAGCVHERRV